jgi:hypothetical protein
MAATQHARLDVRRRLTGTPLERRLELRVREHARTIDWMRFDRSQYPEAALALAFDAQRRLAIGEYGAITLFARVASALALHGAPFDLICAGAEIPADEARHAELAVRVAALVGGCEPSEVSVAIDRDAMEGSWQRVLDVEALDHFMVDVAAISETMAAALLTGCQRTASDPLMRAFFKSLVADEIHHARLGWYYLAWRSPSWSRAERQRVADRAGDLVADIEHRYWKGRDAPRSAKSAARALGVLDSVAQRGFVRQVMEDEIVPGLDALGLGASHAWRKRRRGR